MRIPKANYKPQPTTAPTNMPATTFISTVAGNAPFNGQLLGNDFGLDLGDIDASAGESFTLYKSDFDECGLPEESHDFSIQPGPGSQQNNATIADNINIGTPKHVLPVSIGSLSTRSPGGIDGPSELRREILRSITPGNLKRNEPSPISGPSPGNANAAPTALNNKKQHGPKYQFDIATDFPSHARKPAAKRARAPRAKKEASSGDTIGLSNSANAILNNDIIGPSASASFTISIPSTSKTPATTMYLPFIARRQSLKSHELREANLNLVRACESAAEKESRRKRVMKALNDDSTEIKDVKYFVDKNIEEYLEKRGYLQPYLRAEKVITKGIFASILSHENSISNCVSFGPQYEAHEIIGEIERFWAFYLKIKKTNLTMSLELKLMLVPMLLYFYLECFVCGLVPVALRLYVEFSKKFLTEDATQESYDILFRIATITSPECFDESDPLQAFRNQERRFILSLATFESLKKHVLSSSCPLMLHLFSNRFTIQVKDTAIIAEKFVEYPYVEPQATPTRSASRAAEVIRELRENVEADLPVLELYLTNGRPLCGAASPSGSMIAFGMRDGRGISLEYLKASAGNDESEEEACSPGTRAELLGHSGSVYGLEFHPRTKRLFSVGQDCTMRMWDVENQQCKAVYRGHSFPVGALDVSETGILLATGSVDTTAKIWVPERTNYVRLLAGHYAGVTAVKFHPNEAYIATGSLDTSVRLWSVSDGNMARVFTGFDGRITCLGFHESGKYLIAGGSDPVIRVWDIAQGEVLSELRCPSNCTSLAISQNILTAAFENNQVRFWNLLPILSCSSSDLEDGTHYVLKSKKADCESNSLLKLHFSTPRHVICLGEEYNENETATSRPDSPQIESDEEMNAESSQIPITSQDDWVEVIDDLVTTKVDQDASPDLDSGISAPLE